MKIAFLGLGAMGQRMALRLQQAGHSLVVWSRSGVPDTAGSLKEFAVSSPRHAVSTAELVISMLTDDEASQRVWDALTVGALRPGAIVTESSTLTPAWVARLSEKLRAVGAEFLDAPVVGSRPQAEAGALVYLVGGEAQVLERVRPVLSAMGSAAHHVGPTPNGALAKLMVNGLFSVQIAALAELIGFAHRSTLDPAKLIEVLGDLPVMSPAAKAAAGSMLSRRFAPMFPLALAAKDLRYLTATARSCGGALPVSSCVSDEMTLAAEGGLAEENLTALVKRYLGGDRDTPA